MTELDRYLADLGRAARQAARAMAKASTQAKNAALLAAAETLRRQRDDVLAANAADLAAARAAGCLPPRPRRVARGWRTRNFCVPASRAHRV